MPSDWKSGYCASVTIRNSGTAQTSSWGLVIGLNGSTLNHAWNARITPSDGQLNAVNEAYNGKLAPGASTMWGFCGSGTGRPTVVAVDGSGGTGASTSTSASSSAGSGGATGTGGAGEGGGTTSAGTGGEGGDTGAGGAGEGGGTTTTTTTGGGEGGAGGGGTTTTTGGGEGGAGGGTTTTTTTTGGGEGGAGGGTTTTTGGGEGGAGSGTTTTGAGGAPPLDPACGPDTATFADVAPILEKSCSNQYCHGNPTSPAGRLDLRTSTAVGALVNQDAGSCSSEHALVVPFMPSNSYLMNKLKDVALCDPDESSMPPGSSLPEAELKTINDWICSGAPDR
ncbi:cellulose binding domain-containing protein [Sorangium sp. So ce134]